MSWTFYRYSRIWIPSNIIGYELLHNHYSFIYVGNKTTDVMIHKISEPILPLTEARQTPGHLLKLGDWLIFDEKGNGLMDFDYLPRYIPNASDQKSN